MKVAALFLALTASASAFAPAQQVCEIYLEKLVLSYVGVTFQR